MTDRFTNGLGNLPFLAQGRTRSISAENPTGEKGGGAHAVPDERNPARFLGKGWKVRPCIMLAKESTEVLADIAGPGEIRHIWITVDPMAYRNCVLRFYWDNSEVPSVEVPLGDFFANGHRLRTSINSLPVCVNSSGGFNSYWPMPFRKHCRITIENQSPYDIHGFFYQITYQELEVPAEAAYFHARWRRTLTERTNPEHVILDKITGRGQYVGTYLAWTQLSGGWWGEGEIKFFIDGDGEYPTICGTGTEDYVGGAWSFTEGTYSTAFLGYPLNYKKDGDVPKHGLYRWHVMDPIRFDRDLKVSIQALGWWEEGKFQPLTDDIASVAYWYQEGVQQVVPPLPSMFERYPR